MALVSRLESDLISELELDRAFADKLVSSSEFCSWLLGQTKFANRSHEAFLLKEEQSQAKPRKKRENWWRHWWCRLEDGSDSETDIFAVFGFPDSVERIALHIEDKPPHGRFTPNQYLNYRKRGEFMARKPAYMGYSDYATILLAPEAFLKRHPAAVEHFDCRISYESIAAVISIFGRSLDEAGGT